MKVMIASPLEPLLVERVRHEPVVDEVLYDPSLLPAPRYPSDHRGANLRCDPSQQARWDALLARAEALFGYPQESAAGLARSLADGPCLRFVQGTSAGMGAHVRSANLPADVLERVAFASAAGVHAQMLAEFAFFGMLSLRKDSVRLGRIRAERRWEHYAMGELAGQTLAVVGFGHIGRAVAVLARAFAMRVVAAARSCSEHPLIDRFFPMDRLHEAFALADAVVVALPATAQTERLIDAPTLAALRKDGIFVNVGRGSVVDQRALTEMLRSGQLGGAVLDVFDSEPLPAHDPLWTLPNVVLSPHTAGLSVHENERITDLFCDNLRRLNQGRPLRNRVDLTEFY